jgi:hypothetical protein
MDALNNPHKSISGDTITFFKQATIAFGGRSLERTMIKELIKTPFV